MAKPDQVPLYSQQTTARLWEDPLEAALRSKNDKRDSVADWNAAPAAFCKSITATSTNSDARNLILTALTDQWKTGPNYDPGAYSQFFSLEAAMPFAKALCRQALYELYHKSAWHGSPSPETWREALESLGQSSNPQQESPGKQPDITSFYDNLTKEWIISELKKAINDLVIYPQPGQLEIQDHLKKVSVEQLLSSLKDYTKGKPAAGIAHLNERIATLKHLPEKSDLAVFFAERLKGESPISTDEVTAFTLDNLLQAPPPKTLVLPLIVPEQMYVETREERLRLRYTIVAALAAARFNPESADELNVIPVPVCNAPGAADFGHVIKRPGNRNDVAWIPISYEVFRLDPNDRDSSPYKQVVVFWIDSRIVKHPSLFPTNINTILNHLFTNNTGFALIKNFSARRDPEL
ncbi:MAG TPA: hypothetical protein VIT91_20815 [Chthoniobacterales bacterium]